MLILTRRLGEKLIIGNNVVITVLGVSGNQIRIGITAPKEVPVHREEIYERILAEKGTVASNAVDKLKLEKEYVDDNRGNSIDYVMPKREATIIRKKNHLTFAGKR